MKFAPSRSRDMRRFRRSGWVRISGSGACTRRATAWAQSGREIPCFGTTHADYYRGCVPITDPLSAEEIGGEYEENTGHAIVRCFQGMDPAAAPGVLVRSHGPFTWGKTASKAAQNAVLLEEIAALAYQTVVLNAEAAAIPQALHDRHFLRKHGADATYGQATSR